MVYIIIQLSFSLNYFIIFQMLILPSTEKGGGKRNPEIMVVPILSIRTNFRQLKTQISYSERPTRLENQMA